MGEAQQALEKQLLTPICFFRLTNYDQSCVPQELQEQNKTTYFCECQPLKLNSRGQTLLSHWLICDFNRLVSGYEISQSAATADRHTLYQSPILYANDSASL